ncbi:type II secretion system protein M, XcpZ-type [Pseudomonas cuatrocienegasensis]|uniref:Type II secretion system protein M, XcpZ-type n=1 Tax=Pseudomonas cuatrocienegasensis TaxID=543360 RepID=A0ABY1BDH9_9PSED|nr:MULTISPECIES: type II secretion system protein GspM [Pseudomonas]OEC33827.1 type II secretion system protein GspM [Pseudomonas sp. 21C1]SEQ59564.1 type II secretion system protein M, XcpZ-type [Pseudomonas cuatrocienegasensis]
MKFAALHNHWQALPAARKRLLAIGWLVVALMAMYVAARPLYTAWHTARHWQTLASQARALPTTQAMVADDWGRLASASALVLTEVRGDGATWQLAGRMERTDALAGFITRASTRGWRADDWNLSKDAEGLRFDLHLRPRLGAAQP